MTIRIHLCRPYEVVYLEPSFTLGKEWQPVWFEQYLALREVCFREELGVDSTSTSLDHYDLSGYLLLVIADNVCVGGARLNEAISGGLHGGERLPLENDDFMLNQVFPELNKTGTRYAQWTRLVLDEKFRTPDVLSLLAASMAELSIQREHQYCFNVSGTQRARLYRRLHLSQGFRCEIRRDITMPTDNEFGHLEHLLSVSYSRNTAGSLAYQPEVFDTQKEIMAVA